ncbi:MAG: phosphoribosylamine--glycine ligase [Euryarchaeota archaeon]|jgi:phosphoribosylamine--glycine ligase|nr:phosphoribosylamine--glycine ligase [Euryarchaeota archaeon]MBT3653799.1 phosphoribosylamine--glycine ligase [Euryarchaeota archaeon]MBT3758077.1 phosphoribosylamine--glycine ligase [Euryarchaeota archaeon]MBT4050160.1 phosphoribosylamine--glycine ligase [Euryarchaeota archaeon]MBT4346719.1 phosphoribosylamine--glycine ligase [Euryarchaeota archaeon]
MSGMNVLVVGGGGREHALVIGLNESPSVDAIHIAPGNAGTAVLGLNHQVEAGDVDGLVSLSQHLEVDLVIVGPEGPLVDGLADRLREVGISCFGPHSAGAELEGSKLHAKKIMQELNIPTAGIILIENSERIKEALDTFSPPWVVKRDVLAGGKGVVVTESRKEAYEALSYGLESDGFVLLEEFLSGEEASVLVIMDESGYVCLPPSQDHKRVGDGDSGPNTGGMGAYAPAPIATAAVMQRAIDEIIEPMHHYLRNQKIPYRGCLYVGLMIDENRAPNVVEYNVRFGDPETQVTVPLIASDLGQLLLSAAEGRLSEFDVEFHNYSAATIVLASEGYPASSKTGREIFCYDTIIDEGHIQAFVHHAGTGVSEAGSVVSTGGRVLAATGIAPDLNSAVNAAYEIIESIKLDGSHYRSDIAFRAL